jgi:carotenoid cleavage dioxygenase-like enzyme
MQTPAGSRRRFLMMCCQEGSVGLGQELSQILKHDLEIL